MLSASVLDVIKREGSDRVLRALQTTLGYDANTHIPSIDEFIENDYYLGLLTDNGKGVYPYWREKLREIFPNYLFTRYDTVFLRSAINQARLPVAV